MKTKEAYESALKKHHNEFGRPDSLAVPASESKYRDSALRVREAYKAYAKEMEQKGTPIPIWI